MDVDGAVAIVTGAGSGLGRELARGLTDAGATVVAADIDPPADLPRAGGVVVQVDVRNPADLERVLRAAQDLGG